MPYLEGAVRYNSRRARFADRPIEREVALTDLEVADDRRRRRDGSYKWLLWNAAPDAGQKVIYSVARDITECKRAEAERESLVRQLQAALAEVGTLQGFLPICSYCKRIRDDENYWESVETYISKHTNTQFSHSICPSCYRNEVEPNFKTRERE